MTNFADDVAGQHEEGTAKAKPVRDQEQRVINRITALFSLAEDAAKRGDETERVAALEKASALQIQYAIQDTMLRKEEGRDAEEITFMDFFRGETNTPLIRVKRHLLTTVAYWHRGQTIQCSEWNSEKKKLNKRAYWRVFAHESDLRFISSLFSSLMIQMLSMMEKDAAALYSGKPPNQWRTSYGWAWVERINSRLSEIEYRRNHSMAVSEPGTALVLRDRKELVVQHTDAFYGGGLKSTRTRKSGDGNAAGARTGREAANNADLGQKRAGTTQRTQIGS